MSTGIHESNLKPCGFQKLTLSSSAAQGLMPASAMFAVITPEGQDVRYFDHGPAPTATDGNPLAKGVPFFYKGDLRLVKFIGQADGAVLNINYYTR